MTDVQFAAAVGVFAGFGFVCLMMAISSIVCFIQRPSRKVRLYDQSTSVYCPSCERFVSRRLYVSNYLMCVSCILEETGLEVKQQPQQSEVKVAIAKPMED